MSKDKFYTYVKAAKLLGIRPSRVSQLSSKGRFPMRKRCSCKSQWLLHEDDIKRQKEFANDWKIKHNLVK